MNTSTPPLVVFSHLRWDFVFQRPQHLLSRLAQSRPVLFVEEPDFQGGAPGWRFSSPMPGVEVCRPCTPVAEGGFSEAQLPTLQHLVHELRALRGLDRCDAWVYTPLALPLAESLNPEVLIYDCMDELANFAHASPLLVHREMELYGKADVVFTGGPSLYEKRKGAHPNVHLFPSSVDADHFRRAIDGADDHPAQAHLPRPRLGFYGVVDERMDLDLLDALARTHPEWEVVIVGPVVKIDPATLPQHPNLHYVGQQSYEDLPRFLAGWDVCLLPFALNDSTKFISPTKTLEYMAAERPIVSTPIRDVVTRYSDSVYIGEGPEAFVEACERAMSASEEERAQRVALMRAVLAQTSWDRTAGEMNSLIEEARQPSVLRTLRREWAHAAPKSTAPQGFDYLVVGAGFAGSVLAERLASQLGKRVLVVDKRPHIGGNAYDEYNADGLLVHRYGPHIFHTNSRKVFEYLSGFTEWRPYEHRVLASVDGQLVPIPINLNTINQLYGLNLNSMELEDFFQSQAEPCEKIRTSEDVVVSRVGRELYNKFFRNYTRKQWDLDPSELDSSVISRVPIRTNRDDRYFTDTYQAMPLHGFTRMFEKMLDHPNIKVMLNTDYREIQDLVPYKEMVYTGPVDEFFDLCYGKLPYRSLEFKHETVNTEVYQPAPVVNYPNEHLYTRVTEFKYLTGQEHAKTSIVFEYPRAEGDPYYPIPRPENAALYRKYQLLADSTPGVHFVGRLATYKYYNMDQVVAQALTVFDKITGIKGSPGKDGLHNPNGGDGQRAPLPESVTVEAKNR